jgi:hypothetical protein
MPIKYYKCDCGIEQREIVPIDKVGYRQLPNGSWRFDPNAPKVEETIAVKPCECGKLVAESADPSSVKSFLKLNWLES